MLDKKGYDKEEEHFRRVNAELIEKRRKELDRQRQEQKAKELQAHHWMRCPKCGQEMEEVEMQGIMIDRCTSCGGVFFDAGEVDLLLASHEPQGFLAHLGKLFGAGK